MLCHLSRHCHIPWGNASVRGHVGERWEALDGTEDAVHSLQVQEQTGDMGTGSVHDTCHMSHDCHMTVT